MNKILEQIGAALMAVLGPIHDALLKAKNENAETYLTGEQIDTFAQAPVEASLNPQVAGKTVQAYVGGTAIVVALISMIACGKLGKKKPARRRRRKTSTRRTYKRRR